MTSPTPTTDALWHQFKDQLRRFLRARLPSDADADDVLHDVFLRLYDSADRLDEVTHVQGWIYTLARRAVADVYRAKSRHPTDPVDPSDDVLEAVDDAPPSAPLSPYGGEHDVHEEVLSWLRPMIDALPEMYAVPLHMADVEGKTQQEVADTLGLSLSGAKSRVQRARKRLGEQLRRCCEVEFGPEGRAVAFRRRQADRCDEGGC